MSTMEKVMDNPAAGPSNHHSKDVKKESILEDDGETSYPRSASVSTCDLSSILDHLKVEEPPEAGVIKNLVGFLKPSSVDEGPKIKQEIHENDLADVKQELVPDEEVELKDLNLENCHELKTWLKVENDDSFESKEILGASSDLKFRHEASEYTREPSAKNKENTYDEGFPSTSLLESFLGNDESKSQAPKNACEQGFEKRRRPTAESLNRDEENANWDRLPSTSLLKSLLDSETSKSFDHQNLRKQDLKKRGIAGKKDSASGGSLASTSSLKSQHVNTALRKNAANKYPLFTRKMTYPTTLTQLPEDVIIVLSKYLRYEDLYALSAVDTSWDQAFNLTSIWNRFCSTHPQYFATQSSKTNSVIVNRPEFCETKQRAANERIVLNNMLEGKYTITQFSAGLMYCDTVFNFVDGFGIHWLFVSCSKNDSFTRPHMIQVWSLNEDPTLHLTIVTPLQGRMYGSRFQYAEKKLCYITLTEVLVYKFDYTSQPCSLELSCSIDCDVPAMPAHIFVDNSTLVLQDLSKAIIVSFLYTNYHMYHGIEPYFHVWNMEGDLITKNYDEASFLSEIQRFCYSPLTPGLSTLTSENEILVVCHHKDNAEQVYDLIIFDGLNLSFTKFHLRIECCYLLLWDMLDDIVGVVCEHMDGDRTVAVSIECYDTDKRIVFHTALNGISFNSFHLLNRAGSICLSIYEEDTRTYLMFDIFRQKEIFRFKFKNKRFRDMRVKFVLDATIPLAIIECTKGKSTAYEVWNIKAWAKLYSYDVLSQLGKSHDWHFSALCSANWPPKIIAHWSSESCYPKLGERCMLAVINYW